MFVSALLYFRRPESKHHFVEGEPVVSKSTRGRDATGARRSDRIKKTGPEDAGEKPVVLGPLPNLASPRIYREKIRIARWLNARANPDSLSALPRPDPSYFSQNHLRVEGSRRSGDRRSECVPSNYVHVYDARMQIVFHPEMTDYLLRMKHSYIYMHTYA